MLLVHGFGVNYRQWRKTIAAVAKDHKVWVLLHVRTTVAGCDTSCAVVVQVYAIDLLGFGGSDKAPIDYSIELWAEQVADFCQEFAQEPVTLVGNSIGSLVSLEAAHMMHTDQASPKVRGIVLVNCAGAFWLL